MDYTEQIKLMNQVTYWRGTREGWPDQARKNLAIAHRSSNIALLWRDKAEVERDEAVSIQKANFEHNEWLVGKLGPLTARAEAAEKEAGFTRLERNLANGNLHTATALLSTMAGALDDVKEAKCSAYGETVKKALASYAEWLKGRE